MSYSDELMHSDDTTTIFPRYPDTLLYVYTRNHSTLRFSTLPPSLSFYPTSGRTARMFVIPVIEPDLAERARIDAFDLDDYQYDPETEVRKSSVSIAATLRGETSLTVCMTCLRGQLHTTLEDMDSYPTASEALAAAVVTHAASTQEETNLGSNTSQNKACTYKEFCAVMQGNFRGTEGAVGLTRWFEMLESYTDDTTLTHALLPATTMVGQDIRPRNAKFHLVLQAKEVPEPKGDRVVMLLASDAVKRAITRTSAQTMETKAIVTKFEDNNVVNGTFLINNIYASVLFDTGADRSFVSSTFSKNINVTPTTLDTNYDVELADGKSLTANTILKGCTLNLQIQLFNIDLLLIELGSFDVIIGMDWMSEQHAKVVCHEKYVRVPYGNDVLIIQSERSRVRNESILEVILSIRTQRYIEKGRGVFLIQVTKKEGAKIPEK
ncbi:putative reverse transcriptase domain-containing protein [Tanacetum coccineum]